MGNLLDMQQKSTAAAPDLVLRQPGAADGGALWALVRECGTLSVNSCYAYVLMADHFGPACALAERGGRPVGAIVGFRPPAEPQTLFVWQIGVHPDARGLGVAQRMLDAIFDRPDNADLTGLLTTVAPDNQASERVFRSFAQRHQCSIAEVGGYRPELFPDANGAERLFRVAGFHSSKASSC